MEAQALLCLQESTEVSGELFGRMSRSRPFSLGGGGGVFHCLLKHQGYFYLFGGVAVFQKVMF